MRYRFVVYPVYIFILTQLALSVSGHAEVIEFPTEELARESVLPVFTDVKAVRHRNVVTEGRFEFGGGMGFNLTEALYNNGHAYLTSTYHLTEDHGINLVGYFLFDGLSSAAEDLKVGKGLSGGQTFDASKAPSPETLVLGSYQLTAYYGKISLTKKWVMNLSLYGLAGLGMIKIGDQNNVAGNVGLGQKFYFSDRLALRTDLRMIFYQGPDPTSNTNMSVSDPAQPASAFAKTTFFHSYLSIGLVFLL